MNDKVSTWRMKDEELLPLVGRTIAGDGRAWHSLWLALDPRIERIAGRWRVTSRLSARHDERRNIVVAVMGRLKENDFARLKGLHEVLLRGEGDGWRWIVAMTRRTALNYARLHEEHLGTGGGEDGLRWAELGPISDEIPGPADEARVIAAIQAHEIQAYAEQRLRPDQLRALCLWLMGHDADEIAHALGLPSAREADKLVESALYRLRYRFAGGGATKKNRPGVLGKWRKTLSRDG